MAPVGASQPARSKTGRGRTHHHVESAAPEVQLPRAIHRSNRSQNGSRNRPPYREVELLGQRFGRLNGIREDRLARSTRPTNRVIDNLAYLRPRKAGSGLPEVEDQIREAV